MRELFRREIGAFGYVEGKNVAFEYRYAEGKLDRLPALADELVRDLSKPQSVHGFFAFDLRQV